MFYGPKICNFSKKKNSLNITRGYANVYNVKIKIYNFMES